MKYSQSLIAQALMINASTEVVSYTDHERQSVHSAVLQLFVVKGETRASRLHTVYLPKEGTLMQYDMAPLRIHNSVSNVDAYRNRLMYMQVGMDDKARETDEEKRLVRNSAPYKFNQLMSVTSKGQSGKDYANPYNTVFVTGIIRLAPVPSRHNDPMLIQKFNQASLRIRTLHDKLVSAAADPKALGTNPNYRKIMEMEYEAYLNNMKALINSGEVALAQVISANESSVIPAVTCDSTMELDNPYFNAVYDLKNHISYTPTVNQFYGNIVVDPTLEQDDLNSEITLGLKDMGREEANADGTMSPKAKRQKATLAGVAADSFGNKTSILAIRQDAGYINTRNSSQRGLAETFMDVASNNNSLFISGKLMPMVAQKDVGGSANGILRMTVEVNDYASNRTTSMVSSMDSSLDLSGLDSLDAAAILEGKVDFQIDSKDSFDQTDEFLNGMGMDSLPASGEAQSVDLAADKAPVKSVKKSIL